MDKLKYERVESNRLMTNTSNHLIVIGNDSGSLGVNTYYYIEVNGKVISHGHKRLKDAKKEVESILTRYYIYV